MVGKMPTLQSAWARIGRNLLAKQNAPQCGAFCRHRVTSSPNSPLHRRKELIIRFGALHLVQHEFHRGDFVHAVQEFAQDPDFLQQVRFDQQVFATGAGLVDVDRGVDAFLGDVAVEVILE